MAVEVRVCTRRGSNGVGLSARRIDEDDAGGEVAPVDALIGVVAIGWRANLGRRVFGGYKWGGAPIAVGCGADVHPGGTVLKQQIVAGGPLSLRLGGAGEANWLLVNI